MMQKLLLSLILVLSPMTWAQDKSPAPNISKGLELSDLGFGESDLQKDLVLKQKLEDRRYYLKQHQAWGIAAAAAMTLAVMTGGEGELPPEHPYFAGLAAMSYGAAAYTSYMAPELEGTKSGGSAWHRRLVWIHLPGMILTPILGYQAAKKIDKGEKLDGPEKYHKDVAGLTAAALIASVFTVSFEF